MKYKLKKWYPSLPKDWEVGMEVSQNSKAHDLYSPCSDKHTHMRIISSRVENNPEFWEKVVEKDYEILNLNIDNSLVTCNNHGRWGNRKNIQECTLEWLLKEYPNSIHSIKRKDGEIFSVGDKLDLRAGGVRKITGISLDDSGVSEFSKRSIPWLECGKDYGTCLDWAVHYKEPILITEDGKEMFEGDSFYCVMGDYDILSGAFVSRYVAKEFKYFSTKEAAEKYIEDNKPMYSKKDMLSFGASMSPTLYPYQCEGCLEQWKKFKRRE